MCIHICVYICYVLIRCKNVSYTHNYVHYIIYLIPLTRPDQSIYPKCRASQVFGSSRSVYHWTCVTFVERASSHAGWGFKNRVKHGTLHGTKACYIRILELS